MPNTMRDGLWEVAQVVGTNPVVGAISFGHAGFSMKVASETVRINASGKHTSVKTFPGTVKFSGTLDFLLDSTTVALLGFATPKVPTATPPAKIYPVFTIDNGKWKYTGCKASGLKMTITLNKEIICSMDITAMARVASTTVIVATDLSDPWVGTGVTYTLFPNVCTESIDITIANGLKEIHCMNGTTRTPTFISEGYENIDVDIKYNVETELLVDANVLAALGNATIILKTASGAAGGTITLVNVLAGEDSSDSKPEDIVRFGMTYSADEFSIA